MEPNTEILLAVWIVLFVVRAVVRVWSGQWSGPELLYRRAGHGGPGFLIPNSTTNENLPNYFGRYSSTPASFLPEPGPVRTTQLDPTV